VPSPGATRRTPLAVPEMTRPASATDWPRCCHCAFCHGAPPCTGAMVAQPGSPCRPRARTSTSPATRAAWARWCASGDTYRPAAAPPDVEPRLECARRGTGSTCGPGFGRMCAFAATQSARLRRTADSFRPIGISACTSTRSSGGSGRKGSSDARDGRLRRRGESVTPTSGAGSCV
jgi:hypothetical protein